LVYSVPGSSDRTVRLWDVTTGKWLQTLEGHTDWVTSVAFSTDGTRLASASYDKTIRLWDVTTGKWLQTLEGHTDWVTSVAFSTNGTRLASASSDETVRLWDAVTGALLTILEGHTNGVTSVAFSTAHGSHQIGCRVLLRMGTKLSSSCYFRLKMSSLIQGI
jgi:WD40 repeat protein